MQTIKLADQRYEATCKTCTTRVTGRLDGSAWRHDTAPTAKHEAWPTGLVKQI